MNIYIYISSHIVLYCIILYNIYIYCCNALDLINDIVNCIGSNYIRLYHIKMKPYYTYLSAKEFELLFLMASNYDTGFHNSDLTPPQKKNVYIYIS